MIRCGVFLRQSDADDELAVDRQWDEIIEKICEPRGWEPVRYCDNDRTAVGAKRSLPDRDRMLRDVESGALQAIAVWDCDRLYREPVDLEHIIAVADRHHTLLATVTGDIDLSTDNGRLFARIKGAVAKAECERRSARQKAKYRQLADSGKNLSHLRSFGRHHDGSLHPVEATLLAQAYELILARHSAWSIMMDWNRRGVTTTMGNRWVRTTQLTLIMKNPRNAGLKSYKKQVLDETEAAFEPIVSPEVWRAVQAILGEESRRPVDLTRKHFLTGVALCAECAGVMRAAKTSHGKELPIYQCRKCYRTRQPMEYVDDHVVGIVVGRLSRPDARELLVNQSHPDLDAKRLEVSALRSRLKSLAVDFAEGELDSGQLKIATARIKSKLSAAEQAIEDANRTRLFQGVVGPDAKLFPALALARRRVIVEELMTVTLEWRSLRKPFDPESIVIDWKRLDETV